MKIALDGMGGDKAPQVVVEGAALAASRFGYDITLIGKKEVLKQELAKHKVTRGNIEIHDAPQIVGMAESPVASIRSKKDSSISIAIKLLKEYETRLALVGMLQVLSASSGDIIGYNFRKY